MWFEKLTGFKEENPEQVRKNLEIDGAKLISKVNSAEYNCGQLEVVSLHELRKRAFPGVNQKSKIRISEVVGNVQAFHKDPSNAGAMFQAASQFNLLEMLGPHVTPEKGVGIYENDYTQGPSCAIACGAGTIYRNYFALVNDQLGQTAHNQIDCLKDIGTELKNESLKLWEMTNGYALVKDIESLKYITAQITNKTEKEYEDLKGKLSIGIQWNTEVTISSHKQLVSQAYCSALPVRYSPIHSDYWQEFACLVLEATYEATFYAALENFAKTGIDKVYLTLVGGGAFGNKEEWILDALRKAVSKFSDSPLDVRIVSYG
ncbi:MAG: hypothetical protein ACOYN4_18135, partial [Bacteroidales bacterium]